MPVEPTLEDREKACEILCPQIASERRCRDERAHYLHRPCGDRDRIVKALAEARQGEYERGFCDAQAKMNTALKRVFGSTSPWILLG